MYPFLEQSVQEHFTATSSSVWLCGGEYSKRLRPQWQLPLRTLPVVSVVVSVGNPELGAGGIELRVGHGVFMVEKMMVERMAVKDDD